MSILRTEDEKREREERQYLLTSRVKMMATVQRREGEKERAKGEPAACRA